VCRSSTRAKLRLLKVWGRDEVTGEWRNLHNEELHILYSSPNIIRQIKSRRMRWVGHVARMGEEMNVYRVLMGKPEGKRPLGRPRHRWEDGIIMDLKETGWGSVDWIQLAQGSDDMELVSWGKWECMREKVRGQSPLKQQA
jgi:hypothetical protein